MLFFLRGDAKFSPTGRALEGLENLARAGVVGHHLVLGDRSLLEALSNDARLSKECSAFYRRMAAELTQLGSVVRAFDRINVDAVNDVDLVVGDVIPVGLFSNAEYCEKSQVLVENLTDFEVFYGLSGLRLKKVASGLGISARAMNGGGSTTPQVLEHLDSVFGGPVVCVVDSDRKFENSGMGSTALSTRRKFSGLREPWRFRLHVLEVRELENLIPKSVRRAACASLEKEQRDGLVALDGLTGSYSLYCCLKGGDSSCRMLGDAISKKKYDLIDDLRFVGSSGLPPLAKCGTCPFDDGCGSSPVLGAGFLQRVAEVLREAVEEFGDGWSRHLENVVDLVIQVCLALPVRRV